MATLSILRSAYHKTNLTSSAPPLKVCSKFNMSSRFGPSKFFNPTSSRLLNSPLPTSHRHKSALSSFCTKSRVSSFWRRHASVSTFAVANVSTNDRKQFLNDNLPSFTTQTSFETEGLDRFFQARLKIEDDFKNRYSEESQKIDMLFSRALVEEKSRLSRHQSDQSPLTREELDLYDYALSHGRLEFKFNLEISAPDFVTLLPGNWLNDEIVNFYFKLIKDRSDNDTSLPSVFVFNTFFYLKISKNYSHSAVKRWTKNVDIFKFDKILIPIHLGNHWTLAVVNSASKSLEYYDSMGGVGTRVLKCIEKYLKDEHKVRKDAPLHLSSWDRLTPGPKAPAQANCDDCGVFMCQFAECASRDEAPPFKESVSSSRMTFFRSRMIVEIFVGELRNSKGYGDALKGVIERCNGYEDVSDESESESDSDLEILSE
ncbi:hypothetical protein GEMRC1_012580 [Eukaryota sp. GEM-RC1]